ncbi:hypothetical protein [Streptomyces sp. NPDC058326]|uniref:hypothetical protein n=1 Tax=Streptomyces sp. NPDC058326 TaxID=3346447 RepID=UPI0036E9044C
MAMITLVGLPGAPGATSTALALLRTWPLHDGRRLVLAECDPDGGAVLPGALQSTVVADRGLRNLTESSRSAQDLVTAFWPQLIALENDEKRSERNRLLLPGLTAMHQASSLTPVWGQLADLFTGIETHGHDVLVDLGRTGAFGPAGVLALRADTVLVVMRGTLRSMHAARSRIDTLRTLMDGDSGQGSSALGVLLIRQGPYGAREVQDELGVRVVTELPYRPEEAAVLSDGAPEGRGFMNSKLMNAARDAATPIRQTIATRRARVASPLQQRLLRGASGAR